LNARTTESLSTSIDKGVLDASIPIGWPNRSVEILCKTNSYRSATSALDTGMEAWALVRIAPPPFLTTRGLYPVEAVRGEGLATQGKGRLNKRYRLFRRRRRRDPDLVRDHGVAAKQHDDRQQCSHDSQVRL